ncbi:MAG: DUF3108 domain-containing protein, partial [Spirochaetota bacterium]
TSRGVPPSRLTARLVFAVAAAGMLLSGTGAALNAEQAPCDIHDEYTEYMRYDVSYIGIGIGSVEMYSGRSEDSDDRCGLTVMETFPDVGFLRVYTEYVTHIADDGFFSEAHLWDEDGDSWHYETIERSPRTHVLERFEGSVDDLYDLPDTTERLDVSFPGEGVHDATSFVNMIRDRVRSEDEGSSRLYDQGRIEPVPFRVVDVSGTREVEAFARPQSVRTVEVELDFEGIHGLQDAIVVDFTRDERAIPLFAEAAIMIGQVRMELVEYEHR